VISHAWWRRHSSHHSLTSTQHSEDHRPAQYLCSASDHGPPPPQTLHLDFCSATCPIHASCHLFFSLGYKRDSEKLISCKKLQVPERIADAPQKQHSNQYTKTQSDRKSDGGAAAWYLGSSLRDLDEEWGRLPCESRPSRRDASCGSLVVIVFSPSASASKISCAPDGLGFVACAWNPGPEIRTKNALGWAGAKAISSDAVTVSRSG